MDTSYKLVTACYTSQLIPTHQGNPLIEALPPMMTDTELLAALQLKPAFAKEQREWDTALRLAMLPELENFMVPLQKHVQLGRALDGLLRSNYVGRAPWTAENSKIYQELYELQAAKKPFRQTPTTRARQRSTALIGISGMGKTTTVERWCAHLPEVIHHPKYNLYQIPALHVEMPSDGASVKGMAQSILERIDYLVPGSDFMDTYWQGGRASAESMLHGAARAMQVHSVGLLICDEVQNLANSRKGVQTVMTELVSACNVLKVPILFIGTNQAAKVLGISFRQGRRSVGQGLEPWDRLYQGKPNKPSEWDGFLEVLWHNQWVRKPSTLDQRFKNVIYDYSQGVIDIAIKLFAAAQARAMLDSSECLTPELLEDVYLNQFQLVHPMLDALRRGDYEALAEYDDIAPLNYAKIIEGAVERHQLLKSPLFTVRGDDPTFAPRIAGGLTVFGLDGEEAAQLAEAEAAANPSISLAKGITNVVSKMTKPKPVRAKKGAKEPEALPPDRFDERPADYRRAVAHSAHAGTTVLSQLIEFGMAPQLEELLEL